MRPCRRTGQHAVDGAAEALSSILETSSTAAADMLERRLSPRNHLETLPSLIPSEIKPPGAGAVTCTLGSAHVRHKCSAPVSGLAILILPLHACFYHACHCGAACSPAWACMGFHSSLVGFQPACFRYLGSRSCAAARTDRPEVLDFPTYAALPLPGHRAHQPREQRSLSPCPFCRPECG